ncbi:MAG: molybdopterin-dependent oxidoreductase [Chitinophagaceae bacterium]
MNNINTTIRNKSIVSFLVFGLGITAAVLGWNWLHNQPKVDGAFAPLRSGLELNEKIFKPLVSQGHLVKTYPVSAADKKVRFNGADGLKSPLDSNWKLQVIKAPGDTLLITLDDIKKLPKTDIVFDFKCVEGWSQITHWGGVKMKDFMDHYGLYEQGKMSWVGLNTPDKKYYVGLDMPSAVHPQTLLCYEMNGLPLPLNQGYPLRLIIPVKYGIKHLKRIGTIFFSNQRPPDFWAEKGYDYFAGL